MTDFSQHFTVKKLLRFTLPTMATMLLSSVYGIIDGLFVSNLVGKTAFASVTIMMPFVMILSTVGMMMGAGGSAAVGRMLGAGRSKEANEAFSLIAWFTFGVGVVAAALGGIFMESAVRALGASEDMVPLASAYARVAFFAMPMFMLQYTLEVFSATAGKPRIGLYSAIVSAIVNISLDALFVGVLHWGVVGAALATSMAVTASTGLMIVLFLAGKAGSLRLGRPVFRGSVLLQASYNGVSEMVGSMAMSAVAVVYNMQLMTLVGENGVAAYGVIEYATMLFGAVVGGFVEGAAPLMSYQHGAANNVEKQSLLKREVAVVAAGGMVMFVAAHVFSQPLAAVFVGYDPELMAYTQHAFGIYSFSLLFFGFTMLGSSVFTALGSGAISAVIAFTHTVVFEIGSVLLLPYAFGPNAIWVSITVAEIAATLLTVMLLNRAGPKYGLSFRT